MGCPDQLRAGGFPQTGIRQDEATLVMCPSTLPSAPAGHWLPQLKDCPPCPDGCWMMGLLGDGLCSTDTSVLVKTGVPCAWRGHFSSEHPCLTFSHLQSSTCFLGSFAIRSVCTSSPTWMRSSWPGSTQRYGGWGG